MEMAVHRNKSNLLTLTVTVMEKSQMTAMLILMEIAVMKTFS